jgi:hypothetical protein
MMEYPEVPPIPAGWKMPPYFSTTPLWPIYEKARACEGRTPTELGAIKLGGEAFFFLTGFQPPPGSDYLVAEETTPPKIRIFFWINRTKSLLDYLDAYLTEVRREGTPEQIKFLRDILDKPTHEDDAPQCSINGDADDDDSPNAAQVVSFPEPSEAITILERIAQSHASTSVEYVALQITIRALRYLIESGEAPEFMRYVDQMSKWEPPPSEPSSSSTS